MRCWFNSGSKILFFSGGRHFRNANSIVRIPSLFRCFSLQSNDIVFGDYFFDQGNLFYFKKSEFLQKCFFLNDHLRWSRTFSCFFEFQLSRSSYWFVSGFVSPKRSVILSVLYRVRSSNVSPLSVTSIFNFSVPSVVVISSKTAASWALLVLPGLEVWQFLQRSFPFFKRYLSCASSYFYFF